MCQMREGRDLSIQCLLESVCGACVQYAGLQHSDQDVHLIIGVGMSTWNLHLTRGTVHSIEICKRKKQNQHRILDLLEVSK